MTRSGNILMAHYCSTTTACGAWVDGNWMSQYGSRDLANAGQDYRTILRHYYRDIALS
jgi:SpoIID/LytB domain protein